LEKIEFIIKMESNTSAKKEINCDNRLEQLFNEYKIIERDKYVSPSFEFQVYNIENAINNENIIDLSCAICLNILNDPKSCCSKEVCHSFCKFCIDKYLAEHNNCPICKNHFDYISNNKLIELLNKINFKCKFYNEGCKMILKYSDYLKHIQKCQYGNISYEW